MSPHLFVFGLGYVGEAFASHFQEKRGGQVSGTTRSFVKAAALGEKNISVFTSFDRAQPIFSTVTHVLYTIPPLKEGLPPFFLPRFFPRLQWMGYISSTSVYGHHAGQEVTEETLTTPTTPEGKARLDIEKALLSQSPELPVHIFRCAGIYGPGRNALYNILHHKAQRIDHPGVVFSRIHLADIISILEASMNRCRPGQIYNMADDMPASTADVVAYGCHLLGRPLLPLISLEEAALGETGHAFYQNSKKVLNDKIKKDLGVTLQFPFYHRGLAALLAFEAPPKV